MVPDSQHFAIESCYSKDLSIWCGLLNELSVFEKNVIMYITFVGTLQWNFVHFNQTVICSKLTQTCILVIGFAKVADVLYIRSRLQRLESRRVSQLTNGCAWNRERWWLMDKEMSILSVTSSVTFWHFYAKVMIPERSKLFIIWNEGVSMKS